MYRTFSLFKHLSLNLALGCGVGSFAIWPSSSIAKPSGTPIPFVKKSDVEKAETFSEMRSVNKKDLSELKALNDKYRRASAITMDVTKEVKLGLIGGAPRKSSGKLQISKGSLRMELDGAEQTLLIVNKKTVFAVTYPDKALKDAPVQVIEADVAKKKSPQSSAKSSGDPKAKAAPSSALANLLGPGGFLKSFKATGVLSAEAGSTYFLAPVGSSDMTRAQLKVSADAKEIRELRYWDTRENETSFLFSNTQFGAKVDPKIFNYNPPANADVMKL